MDERHGEANLFHLSGCLLLLQLRGEVTMRRRTCVFVHQPEDEGEEGGGEEGGIQGGSRREGRKWEARKHH